MSTPADIDLEAAMPSFRVGAGAGISMGSLTRIGAGSALARELLFALGRILAIRLRRTTAKVVK